MRSFSPVRISTGRVLLHPRSLLASLQAPQSKPPPRPPSLAETRCDFPSRGNLAALIKFNPPPSVGYSSANFVEVSLDVFALADAITLTAATFFWRRAGDGDWRVVEVSRFLSGSVPCHVEGGGKFVSMQVALQLESPAVHVGGGFLFVARNGPVLVRADLSDLHGRRVSAIFQISTRYDEPEVRAVEATPMGGGDKAVFFLDDVGGWRSWDVTATAHKGKEVLTVSCPGNSFTFSKSDLRGAVFSARGGGEEIVRLCDISNSEVTGSVDALVDKRCARVCGRGGGVGCDDLIDLL
jgi:hypothetical protein